MEEEKILQALELCFNPYSYARLEGEDSYKVHQREYVQLFNKLKDLIKGEKDVK